MDDRPRRQQTILVCNEQDEVRGLVRRLLKARRYRVLDAATGSEALRLAEDSQGPIDLLLTDVVMSGIGGFELVLLLGPRYPGMKVLYVWGGSEDALVSNNVFRGAALLQKPFTAEALARKVREVLEG